MEEGMWIRMELFGSKKGRDLEAKWAILKGYMLYDSKHMALWEKQHSIFKIEINAF